MPTPPHFDILGFGALAVDDLLYVEEYPPAESKVHVLRRERQCGGLTGTALVAAARLGSRCAYVGVLGDDELSRFVSESLAREGIELKWRAERADARPAYSTIIVDQRQKTRTIFCSLDWALGADPLRPEAELIRSARVVLVDHHGLEGSIRAARIARESGVGVVADLERDPGGPFAELLALVDHLVISEHFARELSGAKDVAQAAEGLYDANRRAVVVTCGAAGCWYVGEDCGPPARHLPAFEVEVVDTTGCGDVFHGAYASVLARGGDLHQRVEIASAAAALKATQHGGQAGCPTMGEVNAFLGGRPTSTPLSRARERGRG
jgi:sugar/nucleoside kinase (ribokinase family)